MASHTTWILHVECGSGDYPRWGGWPLVNLIPCIIMILLLVITSTPKFSIWLRNLLFRMINRQFLKKKPCSYIVNILSIMRNVSSIRLTIILGCVNEIPISGTNVIFSFTTKNIQFKILLSYSVTNILW